MNYSPELVHRITSDASAWQCIDCKACIICNDSGDPVSRMYSFCGAGDPGENLLSFVFWVWGEGGIPRACRS